MGLASKRVDAIDALKFVLSILVVSIHVGPFGEFWMVPFKRIAVPLFFLITSYYFFSGWAACACMEESAAKLEKYIKRNLQLYLFWFIALWIPSNEECKWFEGGGHQGVLSTGPRLSSWQYI